MFDWLIIKPDRAFLNYEAAATNSTVEGYTRS